MAANLVDHPNNNQRKPNLGSSPTGASSSSTHRLITPGNPIGSSPRFIGRPTAMEPSSPRRSRKLYRYPAAKPPVGEADVLADGRIVRFSAPNGENYEVDLVKMRQRNSKQRKG